VPVRMRTSRPGKDRFREDLVTAVLRFTYRALRRDGTLETGALNAPGPDDASALLSARGLLPVEVQPDDSPRERSSAMRAADLALGLRMLADLLDAGLSMSRTLQLFEELAPADWQKAIPHIRQSVKEGKGLAASLASAPVLIPPLVIGIAYAGEAGSGTAPAIRRAADAMEGVASTRAAVRSALVYPIVLAAAGVASIGILVGVVLPKFALLLSDLNQELPATTRLLLVSVRVMKTAFVPFLVVAATALAGWTAWVATEQGRVTWHEFLLRLPILGGARRSAASARSAYSLAALLDSGVPISEALRHAARSSGDAAIEKRLLRARDTIVTGTSIGAALEAADAFTGTVAKLVRAGEETGRLTAMLGHAARLEHDRAERTVRSSVRLIEPALVLTFALIVALVAAAMLQAVYSVRPVS
jgi:general secretion pathway protein F